MIDEAKRRKGKKINDYVAQLISFTTLYKNITFIHSLPKSIDITAAPLDVWNMQTKHNAATRTEVLIKFIFFYDFWIKKKKYFREINEKISLNKWFIENIGYGIAKFLFYSMWMKTKINDKIQFKVNCIIAIYFLFSFLNLL